MDWNILLFISRWAFIGLFYTALLVLLLGVYKEASRKIINENQVQGLSYGRLKLIHPGSDPGAKKGAVYSLKVTTNIGSADGNDIVVKDPYISRHHARLWWDGTGWFIEDLNSRNGVLIDNIPCTPNHPYELHKKAIITIGEMEFTLVD
jgi:pSer/pThr/pTyr-binding forkhead associated (FHA) protein